MIKLYADGNELDIFIEDYAYTDLDAYYTDLNWLKVNVRWQNGAEIWQVSDRCLLTEDLMNFRAWLSTVLSNSEEYSHIEFFEPCLSFAYLQTDRFPLFRIYLNNELDPRSTDKLPSSMPILINEQDKVYLECPVSVKNIESFIDSLSISIEKFPIRQERSWDEE